MMRELRSQTPAPAPPSPWPPGVSLPRPFCFPRSRSPGPSRGRLNGFACSRMSACTARSSSRWSWFPLPPEEAGRRRGGGGGSSAGWYRPLSGGINAPAALLRSAGWPLPTPICCPFQGPGTGKAATTLAGNPQGSWRAIASSRRTRREGMDHTGPGLCQAAS